jgi:hypothetical protein
MSFPYRLITLFTHQQVAQIIILRFINIGLFAGGMILFRRLFKRFKISSGLINFSLLMLVLIPVVPFLAATINYDNLIFLLVPLIISLALKCRDEIVINNKIPVISLVMFLVVGMLGGLVKYAFLPIFAAIVIYLLFIFMRKSSKVNLLKTIVTSFKSSRRWLQIIMIIALIISGGLFIERYGVNLLQYHSMEPDCGKLHDTSYCIQYGPWARNNRIANDVIANNPDRNPEISLFTPSWFVGMVYRLYFAINYNYSNDPPLPVPVTIASIIGGIGLILILAFWKFIFRIDRRLLLFATVIALYVGALFYRNFTEYLHYRTMLAINGRYLIIILPLLFVLIGLAYQRLFNILLKARAKSFINIFSVVIILLLLQGGGATTHLVSSQANWYWQNKSVIDFNLGLKKIVSPLIIGSQDR